MLFGSLDERVYFFVIGHIILAQHKNINQLIKYIPILKCPLS